MASICPRCKRTNPAEAQYCYFDGMVLTSAGMRSPVTVGAANFPVPFVFPDGTTCNNFNQLAMGCQKNWSVARDFLMQGHWEVFFNRLGRMDLAHVAKQAQGMPDPDRGLDELLVRLPSNVLQPPKLQVEPTRVSLGQIKRNVDTRVELTISNQGMRLLHGVVASNCEWLVLGDKLRAEHVFETSTDCRVAIRIVPAKLRASAKTIEGVLTLTSNGGMATVTVRAEMPIVAFSEGVLAGAVTPREIAVRAKKHPKEAAVQFEKGAVEEWYKANGWTYPVQGPPGSGLGAIQQFFEALGLVKPPVVSIEPSRVDLSGRVGESVPFTLTVRAAEKRPVFAHARADCDWLTAGKPQFQGNTVVLPFDVASVPDAAGKKLEASLTVSANGNQRFVVPVNVEVRAAKPAPPEPIVRPRRAKVMGMGRLVYWSAMVGGWSAFLGWLFAEVTVGRWIAGHPSAVLLTSMAVAGAVGGGLSMVGALSSSQWKSELRRAWMGLAGGAVGGLVGGLVGNAFYALLGQGNLALNILGRVLGWTMLGICIGSWEGLFTRDWRKLRNGFMGGALGGFLAGLLFNPVHFVVGGNVSSRAAGFVLLGLCIGLSIGLIRVLLKEAWLTVEQGFRPGRQLIIVEEVTALGTSEKAQLIFVAAGAKGVEPRHADIERRDDGYYLQDKNSRSGTILNGAPIREAVLLRDGDLIQFGINHVRFNERFRQRTRP